MATEKPILFNDSMIRALRAGLKTQTRRIVNPQPPLDFDDWRLAYAGIQPRCPYGRVGTYLWVRETWQYAGWAEPGTSNLAQIAFYRADLDADQLSAFTGKWRPSIFMPRWAARIVLEVTAVRIERLHRISEDDARAEGMRTMRDGSNCFVGREGPGRLVTPWLTAKEAFADKWDEINGKRAPWDDNPWVWRIVFKLHSALRGGDVGGARITTTARQ